MTQMIKIYIILPLIITLTNCSSPQNPNHSSSKPVVQYEKKEINDSWKPVRLTYDTHPSGAALEVRKSAVDSWLYAQLATNAYAGSKDNDKDQDFEYKLPSYVSEYQSIVESESGYAARTYIIKKPFQKPYVVLAFRGTQFFSLRDWVFGNTISNTQYEEGVSHAKRLKAELPAHMPLVVVGHSLGGAIATYVSLRIEGATAYGFNASHRVNRGKNPVENDRFFISQYGEIAVLFRRPFINSSGLYTTINYIKKGQRGPLARHKIRDLADCLTKIAASDKDQDALTSVEENNLGQLTKIVY